MEQLDSHDLHIIRLFRYVLILFLTSNTDDKPPRFNPIEQTIRVPIESLNDITPGNTTDGGTHTGLFLLSSITLTHG